MVGQDSRAFALWPGCNMDLSPRHGRMMFVPARDNLPRMVRLPQMPCHLSSFAGGSNAGHENRRGSFWRSSGGWKGFEPWWSTVQGIQRQGAGMACAGGGSPMGPSLPRCCVAEWQVDLTSHDGTKILVMGLCGCLEIAWQEFQKQELVQKWCVSRWFLSSKLGDKVKCPTRGLGLNMLNFTPLFAFWTMKLQNWICIAEAARMRVARFERPDAGDPRMCVKVKGWNTNKGGLLIC